MADESKSPNNVELWLRHLDLETSPKRFYKKYYDAAMAKGIDNNVMNQIEEDPEKLKEFFPFFEERDFNIFYNILVKRKNDDLPTIVKKMLPEYGKMRSFHSTYYPFLKLLDNLGLCEKYYVKVLDKEYNVDAVAYNSIIRKPNILKDLAPFVEAKDFESVFKTFQNLHEGWKLKEFSHIRHLLSKHDLEEHLPTAYEKDLRNSSFPYKFSDSRYNKLLDFLDEDSIKKIVDGLKEVEAKQELEHAKIIKYSKLLNLLSYLGLVEQYEKLVIEHKFDNEKYDRVLSISKFNDADNSEVIESVFGENLAHWNKVINAFEQLAHKNENGLGDLSSIINAQDPFDDGTSQLGRGIFGEVSVDLTDSGLAVAIKEYKLRDRHKNGHSLLLAEPDLKSILNEINLLSGLKHRNILKVLGFINQTNDDPPKLVMEYLERNSLHKNIQTWRRQRDEGSIPKGINPTSGLRLVKMSSDICNGMEYLHSHRILHRDLKLDNIMVAPGFNLIIADFGCAIKLDDQAEFKKMEMRYLSILYMAPETLATSESVLGRYYFASDVWSFGVILHFLWEWESEHEYRARRDHKELKSWICQGLIGRKSSTMILHPQIMEITDRCLALNFSERPRFSEIKKILDELHGIPEVTDSTVPVNSKVEFDLTLVSLTTFRAQEDVSTDSFKRVTNRPLQVAFVERLNRQLVYNNLLWEQKMWNNSDSGKKDACIEKEKLHFN